MDEKDEKPIINLIFLNLSKLEKKLNFINCLMMIQFIKLNLLMQHMKFLRKFLNMEISKPNKSSKKKFNTIDFPVNYCTNNINFNCIFKNRKDLNIIAQEEKLDLLDTC